MPKISMQRMSGWIRVVITRGKSILMGQESLNNLNIGYDGCQTKTSSTKLESKLAEK